MRLSSRPLTSLILVVLPYVSNLFAMPIEPGAGTSVKEIVEVTEESARGGTATRSMDEMNRIPINDMPNSGASRLHESYISDRKQAQRPHEPELTQAQKDYAYGITYGPAGKGLSFVWKKIKSMFSAMGKPIRYINSFNPVRFVPSPTKAEIKALSDNKEFLMQAGLLDRLKNQNIQQGDRPPAVHDDHIDLVHGARRPSIGSPDHDEEHVFYDALPPDHDAVFDHEGTHVHDDVHQPHPVVPQSTHQNPNEPQTPQPQPQPAPQKPNEPHDTAPATEAGNSKPKTDGHE